MKEPAKQQLLKEAMTIAAPFLTKEGQKSLSALKELFYDVRSYTRGDTHHTAFREGYKALIDHIQEQIRIAVRGLDDADRDAAGRKPKVKRASGETPEKS